MGNVSAAEWGSHFLQRCHPYGAKNLLLKKTPKIRGIRVICVICDSDNECKTRTHSAQVNRLFENHHLAQKGYIVCFELIEIDTTRNTFTDFVSAIPVRRTTPTRVVAFTLVSKV